MGEGGAVADVQTDGMDRETGVLKPRDGLVNVILPDIGDDESHARLGKGLGHAEPDAARPARDDRDLAFEILHSSPSRPSAIVPISTVS